MSKKFAKNATLSSTMDYSNVSMASTASPNHKKRDNIDFECMMAYNSYLMAHLKREILAKEIKNNLTSCEDQLDIKSNILIEKNEAVILNQQKLDKQEIVEKIQKKLDEVKNGFSKCTEIVNHIVDSQIDTIKSLTDFQANNLRVLNIEVPQTADDYAEFESNIVNCKDSMQKLLELSGDVNSFNELCIMLKNIVKLCQDVENNFHCLTNMEGKMNEMSLVASKNLLCD